MSDRDPSDPMIGRRFYDYRIVKKLAQGGMGAVYLLVHESLPNIRKVLKVVLPEFAQNPFIRDRFQREAVAVSQLGGHPNIVGIDSVSTLDDGQLCMLIPFLDGKPLDEFIREHGGRLAPHRVMHVASHIARALDFAHRRGIVHRDLKPGNVFIEPTDDDPYFAKVLDFGIAKQMQSSANQPFATMDGPLGTPCYMAVEQYEHAAEATPAADVYALAIMIWEMVTAQRPWGEQDVRVLYHKQLHEPPEPPAGKALSPEWEAILRSALAVDPRQRPQSMRQFLQALASALPAIPPYVPSGAEILRSVARALVDESAHDDETVRNQSNRPLVPVWPQRTYRPPSAPPLNAPPVVEREPAVEQLAVTTNERRRIEPLAPAPDAAPGPAPGAVMVAPAAAGVATPVMPDRAAQSGMSTTIGASNGVMEPHAPTAGRWKLALVGLAAAILGLGIFVLVNRRGNTTVQATPTAQPTSIGQPTPPPQPATIVQPATTAQPATPAQPIPTAQPTPSTQPPLTARPTPSAQPTPTAQPNATASPAAHAPDVEIRAASTKPHTSPAKPSSAAPPARPKARVPEAGAESPGNQSNDQTFDPDAVGGQQEK